MHSRPISRPQEPERLETERPRTPFHPNQFHVRRPIRRDRFQKLAERAWLRRRLHTLAVDHTERPALERALDAVEEYLIDPSRRAEAGADAAESAQEALFHRAALDQAIELRGEYSRRAQEHAARLHELDPSRSPGAVLEEAALQLDRSSQVHGLMCYAPGFLYVFRRTVTGLQISASPLDEVAAGRLLQRLTTDPNAFHDVATTTRVDACAAEPLPSGERVHIEVDHEGFWVSVERASRRRTLQTPFPRLEDARAFLADSLREDLAAGFSLGGDWTSPELARADLGSPGAEPMESADQRARRGRLGGLRAALRTRATVCDAAASC